MERIINPEQTASVLEMQYRLRDTMVSSPVRPRCGSVILLTAAPIYGRELRIQAVGYVLVGISLP